MKRVLPSTLAALLGGGTMIWSAFAQNAPNTPNAPKPPGATAASPHQTTPGKLTNNEVPDGIFRHLDKTLLMKNGHAEKVERELKIAGGITIKPNGTVIYRDGHQFKLKENQMATFDGQLKDVTPALTLPENPYGEQHR